MYLKAKMKVCKGQPSKQKNGVDQKNRKQRYLRLLKRIGRKQSLLKMHDQEKITIVYKKAT